MSAEQTQRQAVNSHPTTKGGDIQLKDIKKKLPLRVLSQADWQHWTTKGYVIVRQAVPAANVERLVDLLWELRREGSRRPFDLVRAAAARPQDEGAQQHRHAGDLQSPISLGQPAGAARLRRLRRHLGPRGPLGRRSTAPTSTRPRRSRAIRTASSTGTSIPRIRPLPIGVQGVLSLKKQDGDVGGFQCIPELFNNFDNWVKTQPADRDPMHPDTPGLSSSISRWRRAT